MGHKGSRDHYYNLAKQQGYRSRAAFKLKQLDEAVGLFDEGETVVDLGAAPGGWLQVAVEAVGKTGRVVGVDRQRIDPIEGAETVRGDMTREDTRKEVRALVGRADVVLSDMAPDMTGEYTVDHARSVHLALVAFETAEALLDGGGTFVTKVFDGPDLAEFRADLERSFDRVRAVHPDASRDASSEVYLVGTGFLTAPVRAGDELEVTVEATGAEGDGVAKVEGFTLFVPGAEPGETLTVRVDDVKPRFGFAERVEPAGGEAGRD